MTLSGKIEEHFLKQADGSETLGSPFTARLCRLLSDLLDESTETGRRVAAWPGKPRSDAVALRLAGALHALVLSGADPALAAAYPPNQVTDEALREALTAAIARHDARLVQGLDSPPQTNEIARAAMLLPGFLAIGREAGMPLAIREIGSSAGLNLLFDRFHYRYGEACWGDEASPVKLTAEARGKAPPLGGFLDIASRKGSDVVPVDVADAEERLRLKSYVWPDQTARLERLEAALALARETPFSIEKADAADFIAAELAARGDDAVFVLFHSIMWQYLPYEKRRHIETLLDEAGNAPGSTPLAWLRMEPVSGDTGFARLRLTLWPVGETRDLARCDFHGRWIEWLGG
ncbi:DUF2332 domain-containing protein [Chelativorans xinjiangense]|uniref:DUF2332 domain-containing protein n=1 Tax=Chelativorans xinjiangense TaxID=2681485 RepID=UPI001359573E|nr:DUF2332 family protein [Chelativorans xinjiangense]